MENPFNNSSYHYIFKDNGEEYVTHSESDNIEIMINDKADEVIEEFFQSLLSSYRTGLETSIKRSYFKFDCGYLKHKMKYSMMLQ